MGDKEQPKEQKPRSPVARIKHDPLGLVPGDHLILTVPPRRFMVAGTYTTEVVSLVAEGPRHEVFRLSYQDCGQTRYINVTLYRHSEKLQGFCFINGDSHPVPYRHEKNLETRLKLSIKAMQARTKGLT